MHFLTLIHDKEISSNFKESPKEIAFTVKRFFSGRNEMSTIWYAKRTKIFHEDILSKTNGFIRN